MADHITFIQQIIDGVPQYDTDGSPILVVDTIEQIDLSITMLTPTRIKRRIGKEMREYPDAVIYTMPSMVDFQKQELSIALGVFASTSAYNNGDDPIFIIPPFEFNTVNTPPDIQPVNAGAVIQAIAANHKDKYEIMKSINFGKGDFIEIQKHLDFKNYFNPISLVGRLWIMEQVDHEGIPLRESWVLIDNGEFDYETTLLAVLTA